MDQPIDSIEDIQKKTDLSEDNIRYLMKQGKFPKPVRPIPYRLGWKRDDISKWIYSIPRQDSGGRSVEISGPVKLRTPATYLVKKP